MTSSNSLDCLFEPLQTGNLRLKNRLFMAPMATGFDMPTLTEYFVARARGGIALITTGEASVHPSGRTGLPRELKLETDSDIPPLAELARRVKQAGAAVVLQLNHAGRYSPGRKLGSQPVAPSPIMSGYTGETPRELTTAEVESLISAFVASATRAQEAGFDGVELLSSSGYLISQFLSPLTNHRTDGYGGTPDKRAHFVLSIVREVRHRVGRDFNICVKLDADDGMQGGIGLEDSRHLAQALVAVGVDRLNIWAGWHESPRPMLPLFVAPGAFADFAAEIKKSVTVPVSTVGRITDPYLAAQIIRDGKADLVGIGRALLADPEFARKIELDRDVDVRPCIGCCHCFDQIVGAVRTDIPLELTCAVNPLLGREQREHVQPALVHKNVAVVGAGPAGLEAARIAALRGHRVSIYDEAGQLGGMLSSAAIAPHKERLRALASYYTRQLASLGVSLRLGVAFDAQTIRTEKPHVVVLATGAQPQTVSIPGAEQAHTMTALDALHDSEKAGKRVVVVGGGMIGLETAEHLAALGRDVTVIEMGQIASDMSLTVRNAFVLRLRKRLRILSSTRALSLAPNGVVVVDPRGQEKTLPADTVVMATGLKSDRALAEMLTASGIEYYLAGSCKVPGHIDEAIADGFRVGCAL
ncbi:MAG TPA: FAD-dependent oxidoreductase [Polyangiaceae bacterium]